MKQDDVGGGSDPTGRRRLPEGLVTLTLIRLVLTSAERFAYPFLPQISRGLGVGVGTGSLLLSTRSFATLGIVAARPLLDRRSLAWQGQLGLVLSTCGLVAVAVPGLLPVALFGFALLGIARSIYDVAAQSTLAGRATSSTRARTLAVFELPFAGGILLGVPIAGVLISRFGWRAPFLAAAVLTLGSVPFAGRGLTDRTPVAEENGAVAAAAGRRRKPKLPSAAWSMFATMLLFVAAIELTLVSYGGWLETRFNLEVVEIGALSIALGVLELGGELLTFVFADRFGARRTLAVGLGICAGGLLLLSAGQASLVPGLAGLGLALLGFEVAVVAGIALAATLVDAAERPRMLGGVVVALGSGRVIGSLFGAPLAARTAANGSVAASALISAVTVGVALIALLAPRSGRVSV